MTPIDEYLNLHAQLSARERGTLMYAAYGHVASWDPKTHLARILLPVQRDDADAWTLTDPVPVGTPGYGVQVGLKGGATQENPQEGEQVLCVFSDPVSMEVTAACLTYNGIDLPPGGAGGGTLAGGEILVYHESGTYVYLKADGSYRTVQATGAEVLIDPIGNTTVRGAQPAGASLTLWADGHITLVHTSGANLTMDASGNLSLTSTGTVDLIAASGQNVNLQVAGGGQVKVNGGTYKVARAGVDTDTRGDTITGGSPVLMTD